MNDVLRGAERGAFMEKNRLRQADAYDERIRKGATEFTKEAKNIRALRHHAGGAGAAEIEEQIQAIDEVMNRFNERYDRLIGKDK